MLVAEIKRKRLGEVVTDAGGGQIVGGGRGAWLVG